MKLTDKQIEVLRGLSDTEFRKPMEFGASDASHHGGTARRLAKLGLVEIIGYQAYCRRVNKYRRTTQGRKALNESIKVVINTE